MTTKEVVMDRELLHKKLDEWLDQVALVKPAPEDGEEMVFKLTSYTNGYDEDDRALISFSMETRRTESSL